MIKPLQWDSAFFGLAVGSTESAIEHSDDLTNYDLVYGFAHPNDTQLNALFLKYNGLLIDQKITFRKGLNSKLTFLDNESIETTNTNSPELLNLALQSGHLSRFTRDKNLPKRYFIKLYETWLHKSLIREIASEVFIYKEQSDTLGFVTLKREKNSIKIGLVAVDEKGRGKGIGKALMHKVFKYATENKCTEVMVPTQALNKIACEYYLSLGFSITERMNIYHFWPKK